MGTGIIDVYRVLGKGCTVTLTFSDIVTLTIVSGPRLFSGNCAKQCCDQVSLFVQPRTVYRLLLFRY